MRATCHAPYLPFSAARHTELWEDEIENKCIDISERLHGLSLAFFGYGIISIVNYKNTIIVSITIIFVFLGIYFGNNFYSAKPLESISPTQTPISEIPSSFTVDEQGNPLPREVSKAWYELYNAARMRDGVKLHELLNRPREIPFMYSFGVSDDDPLVYWEQEFKDTGKHPLDFLAELLAHPPARSSSSQEASYVWPRWFEQPIMELTEAEEAEARKLIGDAAYDSYVEFGHYLGYRVGIRDDGLWLYFIAGD